MGNICNNEPVYYAHEGKYINLIKYLDYHNFTTTNVPFPTGRIEEIYNLFFNNILPTTGGLEYFIGTYYYITKNYGDMEKYLRISYNNGNIYALLRLGKCYENLHLFESALNCYKTLINTNKDNPRFVKDFNDCIKRRNELVQQQEFERIYNTTYNNAMLGIVLASNQ